MRGDSRLRYGARAIALENARDRARKSGRRGSRGSFAARKAVSPQAQVAAAPPTSFSIPDERRTNDA
jgi:hypothetical protein